MSLIDDARVVIYDRSRLIIQATVVGYFSMVRISPLELCGASTIGSFKDAYLVKPSLVALFLTYGLFISANIGSIKAGNTKGGNITVLLTGLD